MPEKIIKASKAWRAALLDVLIERSELPGPVPPVETITFTASEVLEAGGKAQTVKVKISRFWDTGELKATSMAEVNILVEHAKSNSDETP
jgi:hypothetical protein